MKRRKEKAPAFQFYPGDWLGSARVAAMTPEQEGAYIRLLCLAWGDPDCSLPDDDQQLAYMSRLGERWLNGSGELVRSCFTKSARKPNRIFHERLLKERKKQRENAKKNSENGVKSGLARRSKANGRSTVVQPSLNETGTNSEPNANSSSSSSSSTSKDLPKGKSSPFKSPKGTFSEHFEIWWGFYPRKTAKQRAYTAWQRAGKRLVDRGMTKQEAVEYMRLGAQEFSGSPVGQSDYCPHPTTWLNGGQFDDDRAQWNKQSGERDARRPKQLAIGPGQRYDENHTGGDW